MAQKFFTSSLTALFMSLTLLGCDKAPDTQSKPTISKTDTNFDAPSAWSEFEGQLRLFYAYIDRDDFDLEDVLSRTKSLALKTQSQAEFRRILHRMSYVFTDPHFIVGPFEDEDYNIIPTSSDLRIDYTDGAYIVLDVRAGSVADKAGIRPGWEIVSADGVPMTLAAQVPFEGIVLQPTDKQLAYAATLVANGKRTLTRNLTFSHNENSEAITLSSPREFAQKVNELSIIETKRINKIGIVRINNSLGNNDLISTFDEALSDLADTDGLIIDLRNTPSGGNTEVARSIIGHFVTENQPYQIHEIPSLEREFTVPRRFVEMVKPRNPHYNSRRVVVLGSYWTGSMGEGLVIGLNGAAGIHTIASDMGDLLGGLSNFDLQLSGARMDIGTETLFHVNGLPREDYIADTALTSSDRAPDGSDPAIAAAIRYLEDK